MISFDGAYESFIILAAVVEAEYKKHDPAFCLSDHYIVHRPGSRSYKNGGLQFRNNTPGEIKGIVLDLWMKAWGYIR